MAASSQGPQSTFGVGEPRAARMFSIAETAHELTVSTRSVWRWIAAGEIKAVRLGRAVRIPASEIERIARKGVPR
ncbi:MAG: helix-turn-helix domain-containing protein [Phycisphaeraceae bacterium]|nr:helix-turn-helix domain-containing protein [Phycisphaeraceae bacterium]